jgi:secreted PhoX family phosphatase
MMRDDSKAIFDDVIARWHVWAKGYSVVRVAGSDPMFRDAKAGRCWDSADDILEAEINSKIMKAVDFQVSEMADPHRSAIHENARNCATGVSVWRSPRLPADPLERGVIVLEARNMLMRRLMAAGVL